MTKGEVNATIGRPLASTGRRVWAAITAVVLLWSLWRAGVDPDGIVNGRGWSQVQEFFAAMVSPELSGEFLQLVVRESAVTVAYAILGTALAIVIGLIGGTILTERLWSPLSGPMGRGRYGWGLARVGFALPRSMHEVVFGLLLVNILGLNPLVAVLAIGVPFGAVTAKVFADFLDEVPRDAELSLRAAGAGRVTALVFGSFPTALPDLVSYSFYRLECAIRSAAVLGIVGAGGLGFQLALSFQSLRYEEMWTLLWALIILSGIADRWSSAIRRRRNTAAVEMHVNLNNRSVPRRDPFAMGSALVLTVLLPLAYWWLEIDITSLWNGRARRLTRELVADSWPPSVGDGGLSDLISDSADTIALAVLSIAMAFVIGSILAFVASRPPAVSGTRPHLIRLGAGALVRLVLLISRSVPPPVWAFVVVFVLFPGLWPGAVALALYNAGVLGRLQAEVVENADPTAAKAMRASGASASGALMFATVPAVSTRFVALGLYRWEVAIRETVIVGVVGAAGLGRRLDEQTSSFDYDGIVATIIALFVVTLAVDLVSAAIRRTLR